MPDRADLLAALDRFYVVGLTPVLSLNGSIPDADVEVTRAPRVQGSPSAAILDIQVTERGLARLAAIEGA